MDFQWMEDVGWLKRIKDALKIRHRLGDVCCHAPRLGIVPPPSSGRRPGISAMMRLKNEAQWIETALRSLAPYVEQFSLVDNGSTDGTPEIVERAARELGLDYTLERLPTEDFGEVCDRALRNTTCRWVLRWDGDMVARTSGLETLARLREFIFSLDAKRYYVVYFPHIQLDGDLFHQDPDHLIHYEDYLFTWSPRLSHTRTGRFREIKYPIYYRRLYFWDTSSFHVNGMDSPEAMISRKYWADWRERNDFIRYPALGDYVREQIRREYGTDSLRDAGARYIRERSERYIPYDRERFGQYPDLLEPFLEPFPLRLVYRNGRIAGRSDIMETLDRLDAEKTNRSVDVVIPTRNREEYALVAVEMLLKDSYPRFRALIVDQSDAPSEKLQKLAEADRRVVYHRAVPEGLPAARNEGIRISDAEFVVFIDDDVIPDPGFIAGHLKAFENDSVGAAAGKIVERNRKDDFRRPGKPGKIHFWTGKLERNFSGSEFLDADAVGGGNMSFRRKVLEETGGFDPGYGGAYLFEETDAALEVRKRGYRIRYSPEAALTHLSAPGGGCRVPDFRREIYWYTHNFMLLFLKHFPRYAFPTWFALRLGKLFRDAAVRRSLAPLTWGFRGFRDGYARYRRENMRQ